MSEKMLEKIKSILKEIDVDMSMMKNTFSEETKIQEDLGLMKDDLTEFVMEVESQYNIEIEDEKLQSLKTIRDLMDLIKNSF